MPLENGSSKQVISHNIEEMQNSGHPHNQAVAAALHNANDEELGFKKLESKVAAGGASDPAAVAAKIGREKYGQREMTAKSEAGKTAKDADIGNPNHDPHNGQFTTTSSTSGGKTTYTHTHNGTGTKTFSTSAVPPDKLGEGVKQVPSTVGKTVGGKSSPAEAVQRAAERNGGEQRHVAGNKVYPSAEHAIKAANAEHAKSGLILGVEKYDPQKHPTALPARGKGSAAHAANEKEKAFQKQWPNGGTVARKDGGYPRGAGSEKQGKENHSALRNKVAANRGAEAAAEFEGPVKAAPAVEKSKVYSRDAQPGMVTQPNSGGPAWKGKNLDDNPVGDSYGSGDCAASPDAAWPGRTL